MRRPVAAALGFATLLFSTQLTEAAATVAQKGDTLYVTGTRGNDSVIIIGVDGHPGIITVKVENQPLVAHFGLSHIAIDLKGGENSLGVFQVNLGGDLTIAAGSGENYFLLGFHEFFMPNLIWGDLSVTVGLGPNVILLEESWIVGNTSISTGDGLNTVVLGRANSPSDLGAALIGNLLIETGGGDDHVEVVKSWIGGQTLIDTDDGNDTVILGTHYATGSAIAGNVFADTLFVATGNGMDGVGLTDNAVWGNTTIQTGHDNDELRVGDGPAFPPNDFHAQFSANGGGGMDTLNDDPGNSYAMPPQFQSFELP
jgi:hypothetical protein